MSEGSETITNLTEDATHLAPALGVDLPVAQSQAKLAFLDLINGARDYRLWTLLGWLDVRQRYRRSIIGPFWLTISMGILVATLGVLYGILFKLPLDDYLPFIATGFVVWGLISALISDGCTAFTEAENIIKQAGVPLSSHVYRMVWRNLIIFGHNSVIFLIVAFAFSIQPGWAGLLAFVGIGLICLNGIWIGLFLGLLSTRYRDVPPIITSIVQVAFFLTPIIWMPELIPDRPFVLDLNPFYHLLELVRAPALGKLPSPVSWFTIFGITLLGYTVTFLMYCRYRQRIAYWL